MEIRQAIQDDTDTLAAMCREIQSLHAEMQPTLFRHPSAEELASFFRERLDDPNFTILLVEEAGEPVGYVMLHIIRRPAHVLINARSYVEIDHIHVRQAHRRHGVGGELAQQALGVARDSDSDTIQLSVWAENADAVAAFESLGRETQRHIMILKDRERLEQAQSTVPLGVAPSATPNVR